MISVMAFITVTAIFAWFNFNENNITSVVVTTGNIEINDFTATAYKYQYQTFTNNTSDSSSSSVSSSEADDPLYDYEKDGTIVTSDLTTSPLKMNKYDPFYVKLNDNINVRDLMTNLVIKFDFTVKAYTDFDVQVNLNRSDTGVTLGASHFLDFWMSETDYSSSYVVGETTYDSVTYIANKLTTTDSTTYSTNAAKERIFYGNKNVEESLSPADGTTTLASTTYSLIGNDTATSLNIFDSGNTTFAQTSLDDTDKYMEKHYSLFASVDYNRASLDKFADSLKADEYIKLTMDYYFSIEANQND